MKYLLLSIALVGLFGWAVARLNKKSANPDSVKNLAENKTMNTTVATFEPVAVLELFTSQGCSSCPSADKLLSRTIDHAGGKKIYALSFHVDYWNRLGWVDPFSSTNFTQRQAAYVSSLNASGAYTPQMVVNGTSEFVGSDESSLNRNLKKAFEKKSTVSFTKLSLRYVDGSLNADYSLAGAFSGKVIHFALVSLSETTKIKRGENGGLTLRNENVVRQFLTRKAADSGTIEFARSPMPAQGTLSVIAFVQDGETGMVAGAAETK